MFNLNNNNKGRKMNTLKKIAFSILASAFVFANANAGELSVTGSAKATYTIVSVDGSSNTVGHNAGKGIGIANEFTLGASGELDNGWTWSMNQDIDGATVQDDKSIVIGMGGLGSFKINISDGGIQKNFASSQSVYGTPVDNGQVHGYTDSADTGAYNSFRYTTITGDTGSDTVDSANGSLAIVGDGIIQTSISGNRLLIDHTVVGATDVNNSGKTFVQDITTVSYTHLRAHET